MDNPSFVQIQQELKQFDDYTVLGVIDLLRYDNNIDALYGALNALKKDYYAPTEKIIIVHQDTEYFYYNNPTGFTINNLMHCIIDLQLPLFVFIFLTTYSNLNQSLVPFLSEDDEPRVLSLLVGNSTYGALVNNKAFVDTRPKNIINGAFSLLGRQRPHRTLLSKYILKHNLSNQIKFNFDSTSYNKEINRTLDSPIESDFTVGNMQNLIYTIPHRLNASEFTLNKKQEIIELQNIEVTSKNDLIGTLDEFYADNFLEIVTETIFECPHVLLTEKTIKPIIHETPFLIFGPAGSLAYLKMHGLETFSEFWDESYDLIKDPSERFLACCKTMEEIVSKPLDELRQMYDTMKPLLAHNKTQILKYIDKVTIPLYNITNNAKN